MSNDPAVRHESVRADGVDLHVARAGAGPPVILLHGFPEDGRSWRRQIGPLVEAGFSVMAPDLRGYHLSDRPADRAAYHLRHLVRDVAALVRASGHPRAHLVGHDWGGIIAWAFAGERPELLDRLVILNAPHLGVFRERAWRSSQLLRSGYVLLFLLPEVPERVLAAGGYRVIREMFRRTPARPGTYDEAWIDEYVAALSQPGALTAALDYYRANLAGAGARAASSAHVAAETLVIWGERDTALSTTLLEGLERYAPRVRVHRITDAGHWVHNEAPEEVSRVMIDFLRASAPPDPAR